MNSKATIAVNRFGLGARPGDLETVGDNAPRWLIDQLQGPSQTPSAIAKLPGSAQVLVDVAEAKEMQNELKKSSTGGVRAKKIYAPRVRRFYADQTLARFINAAQTDYPFHERLVHFWANHFAVSADKQPLPAIAGIFEKEAIRANLGGRFTDMLIAVEKHPAMILYLDNQRSAGPNSEIAKRSKRRRNKSPAGLNENLAREILELHTLGVDGGYEQADVTAFARILTGWSVGSDRGRLKQGEPGRFTFRQQLHEPGSQVIMGNRYQQAGVDQGEAVLRDLATAPATAKHIAEKLVRHFVSDQPPAGMVQKISSKFLESGGDLPTVHRALVEATEPWQQIQGKYKTPEDFIFSAYRAFRFVPEDVRTLVRTMEQLGQPTFRPGSPAGWPDTADYWGGADALYKRIEWANYASHYSSRV
ncbi:MAG: DUF1800 domain-containing protein, partial [Xanthomonadales bacterium]|nr:DUF1800 domain-containing protein [Xanthomonadales bacterium]